MNITVYCWSRFKLRSPCLRMEAVELRNWIGHNLSYTDGGNVGLIGTVANTVLEAIARSTVSSISTRQEKDTRASTLEIRKVYARAQDSHDQP